MTEAIFKVFNWGMDRWTESNGVTIIQWNCLDGRLSVEKRADGWSWEIYTDDFAAIEGGECKDFDAAKQFAMGAYLKYLGEQCVSDARLNEHLSKSSVS